MNRIKQLFNAARVSGQNSIIVENLGLAIIGEILLEEGFIVRKVGQKFIISN